jgi:Flp pilus assembly secretin CpaC
MTNRWPTFSPARLVVVLSMAACAPAYDGVALEIANTPPVDVTVDDARIELPAGVAVLVRAHAERHGSVVHDPEIDVALDSADDEVLRVRDAARPRTFVLLGNMPGTMCIEARVDGDDVGCIDVAVTAPVGD